MHLPARTCVTPRFILIVGSYTLFEQSFRKDSADAQFKFTIIAANLVTIDSYSAESIADFSANVDAYRNSEPRDAPAFWSFHQHAGLYGKCGALSDTDRIRTDDV